MNCREYQEQLIEQFGEEKLSVDLAGHVESCAECRKVWADINTLNGELGDNAVFYPEPHEAELVAEVVDREIRVGTNVTDIRPMRWLRYASVAAAVVLIASTAAVWRMAGMSEDRSKVVDTMQIAAVDTSDWTSADDEMAGGTVSTLLEEYVGRTSFSAGEQLLGDLTDEETAYLETELKRGDLL